MWCTAQQQFYFQATKDEPSEKFWSDLLVTELFTEVSDLLWRPLATDPTDPWIRTIDDSVTEFITVTDCAGSTHIYVSTFWECKSETRKISTTAERSELSVVSKKTKIRHRMPSVSCTPTGQSQPWSENEKLHAGSAAGGVHPANSAPPRSGEGPWHNDHHDGNAITPQQWPNKVRPENENCSEKMKLPEKCLPFSKRKGQSDKGNEVNMTLSGCFCSEQRAVFIDIYSVWKQFVWLFGQTTSWKVCPLVKFSLP